MTSAPFAVASLRLPKETPFVAVSPAPPSAAAWTARSVTLVRIPIAVVGVISILHGEKLAAIGAFTLFAILDVFDGVAARRVGCDTAARRSGDVVLDRVSIHVAALTVCGVTSVGWISWICLLSRDLVQMILSTRFTLRTRTVIIGAHWHMSYGVSMLVWGSTFIAVGYPPLWLTIAVAAVSGATFFDYARRCAKLERQFLSH